MISNLLFCAVVLLCMIFVLKLQGVFVTMHSLKNILLGRCYSICFEVTINQSDLGTFAMISVHGYITILHISCIIKSLIPVQFLVACPPLQPYNSGVLGGSG